MVLYCRSHRKLIWTAQIKYYIPMPFFFCESINCNKCRFMHFLFIFNILELLCHFNFWLYYLHFYFKLYKKIQSEMSYISTQCPILFLTSSKCKKNKSNNINNGCLGEIRLFPNSSLKSSNQEKIKLKEKNKMTCPTGPNSNSMTSRKCSHKCFLFFELVYCLVSIFFI